LWQGLVIDGYFVISREPAALDSSRAASVAALETAEKAYKKHGVIGSDDKTIRAQEVFKVIGAEVVTDLKARCNNVSLVSAPAAKRIPLSLLSLAVARLPCISRAIAARLAGNWVSAFMFRRPLCCVLSQIFALGSRTTTDGDEILSLSRRAAEELVLAAIFGLVAITDISAKYEPAVYATDASNTHGAFTAVDVGKDLASILWLGGDRKGAYTMLDHPARQMLKTLGEDFSDPDDIEGNEHSMPPKMLDFRFDVVEVCGGSGVLSEAVSKQGLRVCTPMDLSRSAHFNLEDLRLVEWIFQMIFEKRFRGVVVEPVCTTFSPAQHPASRSYSNPLGFDRQNRKTFIGNLIAFRCLAILWFSFRYGELGLLEQPKLSKMAWLSIWKFLLRIGLAEAVIDSCAFGSPHRKPFRLLGHGLNMHELNVRCPGGHQHIRIEGKYTKASAIYHPALAAFLAKKIAEALSALSGENSPHKPEGARIESVLINDVLQMRGWKTLSSWAWERPAHINILESRSYVGLTRHLLLEGGDRRFNALLDSRVAKGAHAKGRFSHQFSRATAGWIRLFILISFCLCPGESAWISSSPDPASSLGLAPEFWTFPLSFVTGLLILHQWSAWIFPSGGHWINYKPQF
jgi:hypothetical protein